MAPHVLHVLATFYQHGFPGYRDKTIEGLFTTRATADPYSPNDQMKKGGSLQTSWPTGKRWIL